MGAKFINDKGEVQDVELPATVYAEAHKANLSLPQYVNRKYPTDASKYGTAFDQMLASCALVVPDAKLQRELGLRAPTMADVLSGAASFDVASSNTAGIGSPTGQQSRTLFPAAIIQYMETALVKDYVSDANVFDKLIAQTISVPTDRFEQPQINMATPSGPNSALSQRRAQLAAPAAMMQFTTSDKIRKIPTFALGMEFSNEALRATTLDLVGMSVQRQLAVERDSWVYSYLSDIFGGDNDINTGSLASLGFTVNQTTLDSGAASGTLTQKAWLTWLFRLRKYRKIDWVICDLATYLKIEGRTGRPSLTAIDTILPRVEAQATVQNPGIGDVKVFLVDDATAGGPLPAGTILGLDSRYAMARVRNTSADVQAAEQYALRQAEAFSIQFGEIVYRLHPDAFDTLVIV